MVLPTRVRVIISLARVLFLRKWCGLMTARRDRSLQPCVQVVAVCASCALYSCGRPSFFVFHDHRFLFLLGIVADHWFRVAGNADETLQLIGPCTGLNLRGCGITANNCSTLRLVLEVCLLDDASPFVEALSSPRLLSISTPTAKSPLWT